MKATIVLKNRKQPYVIYKRGNMAGLAKHFAKKYGGDPNFFTKVVNDEELSGYDEETRKAIAAKAHKLAIGKWPTEGEHPNREKKS